jgi:flagellar motor component MotA
MFLDANALGYSAALLATFLGIGVLVNALIFYTVAQVLAEHRENQERKERRE